MAAQDLQWRFRTSPGHSHLAFAADGSDVGDLWLECRDASSRVSLKFPVEHRIGFELHGTTYVDADGRPEPWPVRVTVESGSKRATLGGEAHYDESRDGSFISVSFPMGGPILASFARTGQLTATAFGETPDIPPAPQELVSQFLDACRP
ncbi:MAG TPA: hypothetical protein VIO94_17595 [Phenylobacterium sp.]